MIYVWFAIGFVVAFWLGFFFHAFISHAWKDIDVDEPI